MQKIIAMLIIATLFVCPSLITKEAHTMATTWDPYQYDALDKNGNVKLFEPKPEAPKVETPPLTPYQVLQQGNGPVDYPNMVSSPAPTQEPDYIGQLAEAQQASQRAALNQMLIRGNSALDSEQAQINPAIWKAKNQAGSQSDVSSYNFAQRAASRGVKGNAGSMPEIYRNSALQGQVGALSQQENELNADIGRRRTELQNNYKNGLLKATADNSAQSLQAYMDKAYADRAFNFQKQQYTDTRTDRAKQEYQNTIGQFGNDYLAEYNKVANDGDPSNDWQLGYLGTARQQKIADQATIEANRAKLQTAADQQTWDNALEMWKAQGRASADVARILGVKEGTMTAGYNIDSMKANKSAAPSTPKPTLTTSQYMNRAIDEMNAQVPTGQVDENGKPIMRPKYTRQQFETYLANLPISDQQYDDILASMNLDGQNWYAPQNMSQILK